MPQYTRNRRRSQPRRRRRLPSTADVAMDLANLQAGSAVRDMFKTKRVKDKLLKALKQTTNVRRKPNRKFPTKGGSRFYKGNPKNKSKYAKNFKKGAGKRLIGLNTGHRKGNKQHITGTIVSSNHPYAHVRFPLKPYQKSELLYYPHPIQQKILLIGNQEVITGSDNNLSDKVDYEDFPHVSDKKLVSTVYYPIGPPANFTGVQSYTRMQSDTNSEGFSKISVLGRQNRCDERNLYDQTDASSITTSTNNYMVNPNSILTGCHLKMTCQSNRNFSTKITCKLVRLSNPGDVVTNQGVSNDELVELTNSMSHIDYDVAEIIWQQSKVLGPCKANKFVNQSFELGWNGYYKLTKSFKDETALTLKSDQGGTFKYGQQSRPKISGAYLSQTNLSNRLVLIIMTKRLGDTQIGMATQTREFQESGFTKTVGVNQPYNQEDGDSFMSTVTGHLNTLPTDNYISDELTTASFRCKAQLILQYRVKEGVRNIPTYVNASSNNGKTKILHASTFDSNYATLNATLNKTD